MEQPTSSLSLVERVKNGDYHAFSTLFDKYHRRLAVLIHYKLGPDLRRFAEVEDILQETLLEAYRDIDQFKYQKPGSFFNWLSRIADHVIADLARSQRRQKRHAADVVRFRSESNPAGPEPVDTKTPSRILAEKEGVFTLIEQLNQLPEDYRQAILLAKVEGLSTQETAERLGKTREATALLLHRAIKRFRSLRDSESG
ncbi:MAG TPA: sigma-70 family RNA polymerase sigma factor [Blastocatellia bacterium]|nr:sigma-70 family RNA polymerase sigma factor [Blastocatellia bacterium]